MLNRREIIFAAVSGLLALAAMLALPWLVAKPLLLFGRSLSAIEPTLFPYVILSLVVALSVGLIFTASRHLLSQRQKNNEALLQETPPDDTNWISKVLFFIILTGYGLMLKPLGFLISSFLAISASSLLLGNRNWLQIALLALLSPVCLYLIATRAMLVSLPELNQIELFYSRLINWLQSMVPL